MFFALAIILAITEPQTALERFRAQQQAPTRAYDYATVDPADWSCADPIIERNYQSRNDHGVVHSAHDLSMVIAEECARPYRPRPIRDDADRAFEGQERLIYTYQRQSFGYEITAKIEQARRRDRIRLN